MVTVARAKGQGSASTDRSARSLATRAYTGIKNDILRGRLRPGEMVLGARLASTYRMSRTPVHEALKTLAKEGLVQVIPRVGYVISSVTVNDVYEIYQLRLVNEAFAMELAATRVTDEDIESLRRFGWTHGLVRRARGKPDAGTLARASVAHRDFHLLVASFSGNRRLVDTIARLLDESERIRSLDPLNLEQLDLMTAPSHGAIVTALVSRKPALAVQAITDHVRQAQARITAALLPELAPRRAPLAALTPPMSARRSRRIR
jgi:DNA-binding GntR family transcriptional regulator